MASILLFTSQFTVLINRGARPSIFELELSFSNIYFNHSNYRFELRKYIFFFSTDVTQGKFKLINWGPWSPILKKFKSSIYVTDGMFCMNGTTNVPKSVLRYTVDKVRQVSDTEVWYSNVSYVQKKLEVFIMMMRLHIILEVFLVGGILAELCLYIA